MRRLSVSTLIATVVALPAAACPTDMDTLLTCQIANRADILEACFSKSEAYYSFGPQGAPDLVLRFPVSQVGLDPWPGVGRFRFQSITFRNNDYSYTVHTSQDRFAENGLSVEGGVIVAQGNQTLASLECGQIFDYGVLEQTHP